MKKSKNFKQSLLKRLKIRKSGVLKKAHISNKFKNIKMKSTKEVQISQIKSISKFKNSREVELERLRLKILDAVRFSKRFWMTYREKTFGIASILNLVYKRSFFEVLFFTNKDVIEKGVPLLKIYTPFEDEMDFGEIIIDPDFDDDGLVSPSKIIARMRKLIRSEFQKHLKRLDKEIELVDLKFESYPIDNNPYFREVRIQRLSKLQTLYPENIRIAEIMQDLKHLFKKAQRYHLSSDNKF